MEALFSSELLEDLAVVTLPAPRFRHDWPKGGGTEAERAQQRAKADVRCYSVSRRAETSGRLPRRGHGLGKTLEVICLRGGTRHP